MYLKTFFPTVLNFPYKYLFSSTVYYFPPTVLYFPQLYSNSPNCMLPIFPKFTLVFSHSCTTTNSYLNVYGIIATVFHFDVNGFKTTNKHALGGMQYILQNT